MKYICIEQNPKRLTGYSIAINKTRRQSNVKRNQLLLWALDT